MTTTTAVEDDSQIGPDERLRVAERLRLLRLKQRIDQRPLAKRAGVSLGTLQMMERGTGRDVRAENIEKVARELGTSLAALRNHILHDHGSFTRGTLISLNREDTEIAFLFHTAIVDVKLAVRQLLAKTLAEDLRETISQLVIVLVSIKRLDVVVELLGLARELQHAPPRRGRQEKRTLRR